MHVAVCGPFDPKVKDISLLCERGEATSDSRKVGLVWNSKNFIYQGKKGKKIRF